MCPTRVAESCGVPAGEKNATKCQSDYNSKVLSWTPGSRTFAYKREASRLRIQRVTSYSRLYSSGARSATKGLHGRWEAGTVLVRPSCEKA